MESSESSLRLYLNMLIGEIVRKETKVENLGKKLEKQQSKVDKMQEQYEKLSKQYKEQEQQKENS